MAKQKLEELVELAFRHRPDTISSNTLLWVEVVKALCETKNITTLDELFLNVLSNKIPTSHSLAAAITNVRKKYPELRPTEEQMARKEAVKQEYINQFNNI